MRRGGQLALWMAVLLATLLLGVPAGAQSLSESGNPQATASEDEDSEATEPEPAEADAGEAVPGVQVVRYGGQDPYALSIQVARALADAGDGTSEWVVLVSGASWADAVAAGPLAASLAAPVVLVPPGGLQSSTARSDLVEFLRSAGTRRVVIVGSPAVLPNHEPSVLFGLGMLPRNIERVHGDDPVGTSIAVAERIGTPVEFGEQGRTVIIASDRSVADAVAVGPLAAAGPFPLLLTAPDVLDARITAYLAEHEVAHVVLVGGTAATAPAVQEAVETAGITVTRLAGADRSETARLAAELFDQHIAGDAECTGGPTRIGLAPAQHPEQALTAGPLLARGCAALRFTEPQRLPPNLHHELFLAQSRTDAAELHVFESAAALPDDALDISKPPVRIAAWRLMADESPAGSQAVLVVSDGRSQPRLYPQATVDISGTNAEHQLPRPRWGPHGRYLTYRDPATGGVSVLDTVSGRLELVRYGDEAPKLLVDTVPTWSPDGSRLIFSGIIDDESTLSDGIGMQVGIIPPQLTAELFLYDIPSGETARMTRNASVDIVLSWSPDGTKVAYGTTWYLWPFDTFVHTWQLTIESIDTGDIRVLPYPYLRPWGLSWSPDNNQILLDGIPDDGKGHGWPSLSSEIFVVDADGSNLQQLTPSNCESCVEPRYGNETALPHSAHYPSWSPGGDKTIYQMWVITDEAAYGPGDEGPELSWQVHDFATGKGRILIPLGPDDLATSGRVVGWANNDELFFTFSNRYDNADDSDQPLEFVARVNANSGSIRQEFEVPSRMTAGAPEHSRWLSMSPDRQHFAASYPQAGLYVYSLQTQSWAAVIDTWGPVGGDGAHGVVSNCVADWTDVGILGTCNEILANEA